MSPIKDMNQLHHLKKGMKISDSDRRAAKPDDSQVGESSNQNGEDDEVNIGATGSASKILNDMKKTKEAKEAKEAKEKTEAGFSSKFPDKPRVPHNQTSVSTNRAAASFTSSSLTPVTKTERVLRDEEELMLEEVSKKNVKGKGKAKAYVRVSFGMALLTKLLSFPVYLEIDDLNPLPLSACLDTSSSSSSPPISVL